MRLCDGNVYCVDYRGGRSDGGQEGDIRQSSPRCRAASRWASSLSSLPSIGRSDSRFCRAQNGAVATVTRNKCDAYNAALYLLFKL